MKRVWKEILEIFITLIIIIGVKHGMINMVRAGTFSVGPGIVTVTLNWVDFDGTVLEQGNSLIPDNVKLTLMKVYTENSKPDEELEIRYISRNSGTVSFEVPKYSYNDECYYVRIEHSSEYPYIEAYYYEPGYEHSGWTGVPTWYNGFLDSTFTIHLAEPETIDATADLILDVHSLWEKYGYLDTYSDLIMSLLPETTNVSLYQSASNGEWTQAIDGRGDLIAPMEMKRNDFILDEEGLNLRCVCKFKNVVNEPNLQYLVKADLPSCFRRDFNANTDFYEKSRINGMEANILYYYDTFSIPVIIEWYLEDGITSCSGPENGVVLYLDRKDGTEFGSIYVTKDSYAPGYYYGWGGEFYGIPVAEENGIIVEDDFTIRQTDVDDYRCEEVKTMGESIRDGFLVKYVKTGQPVQTSTLKVILDWMDGSGIPLLSGHSSIPTMVKATLVKSKRDGSVPEEELGSRIIQRWDGTAIWNIPYDTQDYCYGIKLEESSEYENPGPVICVYEYHEGDVEYHISLRVNTTEAVPEFADIRVEVRIGFPFETIERAYDMAYSLIYENFPIYLYEKTGNGDELIPAKDANGNVFDPVKLRDGFYYYTDENGIFELVSTCTFKNTTFPTSSTIHWSMVSSHAS